MAPTRTHCRRGKVGSASSNNRQVNPPAMMMGSSNQRGPREMTPGNTANSTPISTHRHRREGAGVGVAEDRPGVFKRETAVYKRLTSPAWCQIATSGDRKRPNNV